MPLSTRRNVTGVVLAAGAGTRMGIPKALLTTQSGESWASVACNLLLEAGCQRTVVVLGAGADRVVVPTDAAITTVLNPDWPSGLASSLRAGLAAATGDAALVTVVDMPELPVEVARRVLATGVPLARALFHGRPGHPVLLGSEHWAAISADLAGDDGARAYLDAHHVIGVECGDLYDGHDIDVPPDALPGSLPIVPPGSLPGAG
jgi:CTP:molybdopterin cytidylyltransferase MocA